VLLAFVRISQTLENECLNGFWLNISALEVTLEDKALCDFDSYLRESAAHHL